MTTFTAGRAPVIDYELTLTLQHQRQQTNQTPVDDDAKHSSLPLCARIHNSKHSRKRSFDKQKDNATTPAETVALITDSAKSNSSFAWSSNQSCSEISNNSSQQSQHNDDNQTSHIASSLQHRKYKYIPLAAAKQPALLLLSTGGDGTTSNNSGVDRGGTAPLSYRKSRCRYCVLLFGLSLLSLVVLLTTLLFSLRLLDSNRNESAESLIGQPIQNITAKFRIIPAFTLHASDLLNNVNYDDTNRLLLNFSGASPSDRQSAPKQGEAAYAGTPPQNAGPQDFNDAHISYVTVPIAFDDSFVPINTANLHKFSLPAPTWFATASPSAGADGGRDVVLGFHLDHFGDLLRLVFDDDEQQRYKLADRVSGLFSNTTLNRWVGTELWPFDYESLVPKTTSCVVPARLLGEPTSVAAIDFCLHSHGLVGIIWRQSAVHILSPAFDDNALLRYYFQFDTAKNTRLRHANYQDTSVNSTFRSAAAKPTGKHNAPASSTQPVLLAPAITIRLANKLAVPLAVRTLRVSEQMQPNGDNNPLAVFLNATNETTKLHDELLKRLLVMLFPTDNGDIPPVSAAAAVSHQKRINDSYTRESLSAASDSNGDDDDNDDSDEDDEDEDDNSLNENFSHLAKTAHRYDHNASREIVTAATELTTEKLPIHLTRDSDATNDVSAAAYKDIVIVRGGESEQPYYHASITRTHAVSQQYPSSSDNVAEQEHNGPNLSVYFRLDANKLTQDAGGSSSHTSEQGSVSGAGDTFTGANQLFNAAAGFNAANNNNDNDTVAAATHTRKSDKNNNVSSIVSGSATTQLLKAPIFLPVSDIRSPQRSADVHAYVTTAVNPSFMLKKQSEREARKRRSILWGQSSSVDAEQHATTRARASNTAPASDTPATAGHRLRSYHVEVMVAVDQTMKEFHSQDLQNYVLTLMSVVSKIYSDYSIGTAITMSVTRIIVLDTQQEFGPQYDTYAALESLDTFCNWQARQNAPQGDPNHHYDIGILLTRRDICRRQDQCDTLGLAEIGTMCHPHKSCAIIEDNGLSAAFTIAHEMAHVFNIPHDDAEICQPLNTKSLDVTQNIMAPRLDYKSSPWTWSPCSAQLMSQFLESPRADCLLNLPVASYERNPSYGEYAIIPNLIPGEVFDVHKQCEMVFGKGSTVCPFMPVCEQLWCTIRLNNQTGCRTQHLPWADGTPCAGGDSHWCYKGKCVAKDVRSLTPVDGGWGKWSEYSECSRPCGGGIATSMRECDSPVPANGGRYCQGQRERYRSCNVHECPIGTKDVRQTQCDEFNDREVYVDALQRPYKGHWEAVYATAVAAAAGDGRAQCRLQCRIPQSSGNTIVTLRDKVIDGTPCVPPPNAGSDKQQGVCVNGLCTAIGCDRHLDSGLVLDHCGVCGGDNSTCETISNSYTSNKYGYQEIITIPEGAANVDVRQVSPGDSSTDGTFLTIKDSRDTFVLNGHYSISQYPRILSFHGNTIEYTGTKTTHERFNSTMPLSDPITIGVLQTGELYPTEVRYYYQLSKNRGYRWSYYAGEWSECSSECQGTQSKRVICIRERTNEAVDEHYCNAQQTSRFRSGSTGRPDNAERVCNDHCVLRWTVVSHGRCSSACREPGQLKQRIQCVKDDIRLGTQTIYEDERCAHLGSSSRPEEIVQCLGECDNGVGWSYGTWSSCSAVCGEGLQMRSALCENTTTHERLPPPVCQEKAEALTLTRPCQGQPCLADWVVGNWSACSAPCGNGIQQRLVMCFNRHDNQMIGDDKCNSRPKPEEKRTCEISACQTSPLSSDTNSVYHHIESERSFRPAAASSSSGRIEDSLTKSSSSNSGVQRQYLVEQQATPQSTVILNDSSNIRWRTGPWSECSRSCGPGGSQRRRVTCYNYQANREESARVCGEPAGIRPPDTQDCMLSAVCAQWRVGQWTECTQACSVNQFRHRSVACVAVGIDSASVDRVLDDHFCDRSSRPESEGTCAQLCTSSTTTTSTVPPPPTAVRDFVAANNDRQSSTFLVDMTVPITSNVVEARVASVAALHQQTPTKNLRQAKHLMPSNVIVTAQTSPSASRLPPYWYTGAWTQCSASCGGGRQIRLVICVDGDDGREVHQSLCHQQHQTSSSSSSAHMPVRVQMCNEHACPHWQTTDWSECSQTCGAGGYRTRQVNCQDGNGRRYREKYCEHSTSNSSTTIQRQPRPAHRIPCNQFACPKPINMQSNGRGAGDHLVGLNSESGPRTSSNVVRASLSNNSGSGGNIRINTSPVFSPVPNSPLAPRRRIAGTPTSDNSRKNPSSSSHYYDTRLDDEAGGAAPSRKSTDADADTSQTIVADADDAGGYSPKKNATKAVSSAVRATSENSARLMTNITRLRTSVANLFSPNFNTTRSGAVATVDKSDDDDEDEEESSQSTSSTTTTLATTAVAEQRRQQQVVVVHINNSVQWKTSAWSDCDVACGRGVRTRTLTCVRKTVLRGSRHKKQKQTTTESTVVDDQTCSAAGLDRPKTRRACRRFKCVNMRYRWSVSSWSHCTAVCGQGFRARQAHCFDSKDGTIVSDQFCESTVKGGSALTKPRTKKKCHAKGPCLYQWTASEWGECSHKCNGYQHRLVTCQRILPSNNSTSTAVQKFSAPVSPYLCGILLMPERQRPCAGPKSGSNENVACKS